MKNTNNTFIPFFMSTHVMALTNVLYFFIGFSYCPFISFRWTPFSLHYWTGLVTSDLLSQFLLNWKYLNFSFISEG